MHLFFAYKVLFQLLCHVIYIRRNFKQVFEICSNGSLILHQKNLEIEIIGYFPSRLSFLMDLRNSKVFFINFQWKKALLVIKDIFFSIKRSFLNESVCKLTFQFFCMATTSWCFLTEFAWKAPSDLDIQNQLCWKIKKFNYIG